MPPSLMSVQLGIGPRCSSRFSIRVPFIEDEITAERVGMTAVRRVPVHLKSTLSV
jgi:hypothetical protein